MLLSFILFTFQSGDIQITNAVNNNDISIKFTFQSGDIRIDKLESALYYYIDLHSNLVIFKYDSCMVQCKWLEQFTFQSGDIQIGKTADRYMT